MLKQFTILILYFLFGCTLYAQKENNVWYFGRYFGLDFNTAEPTIIKNSAMSSWEASSCISDSLGNILIYSNGETVWNKKHQIMVNGTGLNGHQSSLQGALILKKPESQNLYYLFTSDERFTFINRGIQYSILDISKNGGNGAVVSKNIKISNYSNEQLCATKHANGKDYWIAIKQQKTDSVYIYLLSKNGISPILKRYKISKEKLSGSYMKFSPNGKYLFIPNNDIGLAIDYNSYLFSFDNLNGDLKFKSKIKITSLSCEFSPNNEFLYLGSHTLYQIKLSNIPDTFTLSNVSNSIAIPFNRSCVKSMQLAVNGKIYIQYCDFNDSILDVINYPNSEFTRLGFENDKIVYENNKSVYLFGYYYFAGNVGLPNIVLDKFKPFIYSVNNCLGDSSAFSIYNAYNDSTLWHFGDGTQQYSTGDKIKHKYTDSGLYNLMAIYKNTDKYDTVYKTIYISNISPITLGTDTLICSSNPIIKDVYKPDYINYKWNTGDTISKITINKPGVYSVSVFNKYNCKSIDSVYIDTFNCKFKASKFCFKDSTIHTYYDNNFDSIKWQIDVINNITTQSNSIKLKYKTIGTHTIKTKIYKGGLAINLINYINIDSVILPNNLKDTFICNGSTIYKNLSTYNYDSIRWNDGDNNAFNKTFTNAGNYFLNVFKNGCVNSDTFAIYKFNCGIISQFNCLNDSTQFSINDTNYDSLKWNFGDGINLKTNSKTIKHQYFIANTYNGYLDVYKNNCTLNQKFTIEIIDLPPIVFNYDSIICYNQKLSSGINNNSIYQKWNTGFIGSEIPILETGKYTLSISKKGCEYKDSVTLKVINCECPVYFPDVFSPDNTGINDIYKPVSDCKIEIFLITIFNTWGEIIYKSSTIDEGWNGSDYKGIIVPQGIYSYLVKYKDSYNGKMTDKKGTITLLR
ncbi:MAG: gliding motility-associated C-terminal domain-containing protein [Bacteroidetes bacterium]|nr:gliding motility-associated C-terminal domain-containing protein [Bacteroidota bacterium]